MKKFPVVSENGNEYLVDIYKDTFGVYCEVFVRERRWFGLKKFRRVAGGIYDGWYDLGNWDYDFIKIAKYAVKKHEDNVEIKLSRKRREAEGIEKFIEWDGVCDD